MKILLPFLAVIGLVAIPALGVSVGLNYVFGIIIPYVAIAIFIFGFISKVVNWAKSPVPFRITTTCGQGKSLPWIKDAKLDCPTTTAGVLGRMALEILVFRSLFRNTKANVNDGPRLIYGPTKWLWLAGLVFHYSFAIIFLRHFRLFVEPIPFFVPILEYADSFFQITIPAFYMTDAALVGAAIYLFIRRVFIPQVRHISLANDYFPLFLIIAVALSGILMRYIFKVNIAGVKEFITALAGFHPSINPEVGGIFYVHMFLVSVLMAYFPFSKLMHLGGVFLSPTRNLANNNRMVRHINPWNDPSIKPHSYAGYEDEFRELMRSADIPLDKES